MTGPPTPPKVPPPEKTPYDQGLLTIRFPEEGLIKALLLRGIH